MKKKVLAVVLAMGCVFSAPVVSNAKETDYSYLEDMSTEELKDLDAAIHNLLGDTSNEVVITSTPNGDVAEIEFNEPITVIDTEDVTLVATGKYFQYDKFDSTKPSEAGYRIELTNHSDYYVGLDMLNASVDSHALSASFFTSFREVGPNTEAKGNLYAALGFYSYGYEFNSIDDLHDMNGSFQIHRSETPGSISSNMNVNTEFLTVLP